MPKILSSIPLSSDSNIYVPSRVINRDPQLVQLNDVFNRIISGNKPTVTCIGGPRGTGKTVTIKHFINNLRAENKDSATLFLVECASTFMKSFRPLFVNVPHMFFKYLINRHKPPIILFLDDFHNLLSREANMHFHSIYEQYRDKIIPIPMTNIPFLFLKKYFAEDTLSRMSWELGQFINFPIYNFQETYDILLQRIQEALAPDTWDEEAIAICAKYGAQYKNLRLSIDLIASACEIAEPFPKLMKEHVEQALAFADIKSLSEDLNNQPLIERLYLMAIALVRKSEDIPLYIIEDSAFPKICQQIETALPSRTTLWRLRKKLQREGYLTISERSYYTPNSIGKLRRGKNIIITPSFKSETLLNALKICPFDDLHPDHTLKIKSLILKETT